MGGQTILSQDHVMFVITPNTSRGYWKDLFSPEKDDWKITGKSLIYDQSPHLFLLLGEETFKVRGPTFLYRHISDNDVTNQVVCTQE